MPDVTTVINHASGSGTFVVPSGVYEVVLEGIGGGGGGATSGFLQNAMGGGGGAYAQTILAVTPGQTVVYSVGTGGAASSNGTASTAGLQGSASAMIAAPGSGGTGTTGGAGGTVAASTGTIRNAGGNGAVVSGNSGTGGAGASGGTLTGGAASASGGAANAPGGGGGSGNTSGSAGQPGAAGYIRLTYTIYAPVPVGPYVQNVTTSGVNTWRAPLTGKVLFQAIGGGSGGRGGVPLASGGPGGAGGAYADKVLDVVEGQRYNIVIGAGGAGGTYNGGVSGNGGDTTVATAANPGTILLLADGATGWTDGTTGGTPGLAANSIGDNKADGYRGTAPPASEVYAGGNGGAAARPIGGPPTAGPGQGLGIAGNGPGGGGSGGGQTSNSHGGAGAPGSVRVAYISTMGRVVMPGGVEKAILGYQRVQGGAKTDVKTMTVKSGVATNTRGAIAKVDERLPPYPVWVNSTHQPYFDRKTGLFRVEPTPNIAAGLASGVFSAVMTGDSLTEGFTYLNSLPPFNFTADRANAYPMKVRNNLAAQPGKQVAGTGMVRVQGAVGSRDPRWVVNSVGDYGHYVQIDAGSPYAEFTSDLAGSVINIAVLQGGGIVGVSIDGGAVQSTATDTSGTVKRISYTGQANTTHTVRVTAVTGSVFLIAAEVTKVSGVRVHNVGQGGATAMGTGQPSWSASGTPMTMLNTFGDQANMYGGPCHMATIMIGANDMSGYSAKDYDGIAAAIQVIGEKFDVAGTDVVLMTEPHGSGQFAGPAGYSIPYYERLYSLAYSKGWALIDLEYLTGGFEYLAGAGYTGDVYGHFNASGATYVGGLLTTAILAAG